MLEFLNAQINTLSLSAVCGFILLLGSRREKTAAAFCLMGVAFSFLAEMTWLQGLLWSYLVIDAAVLAGFVTLCWKSPHPWPLWACGLQLASVMAAVTTLRNPELMAATFLTLRWALNWGVVLVILVGTVQAMQQRRKMTFGQKSEL